MLRLLRVVYGCLDLLNAGEDFCRIVLGYFRLFRVACGCQGLFTVVENCLGLLESL